MELFQQRRSDMQVKLKGVGIALLVIQMLVLGSVPVSWEHQAQATARKLAEKLFSIGGEEAGEA